MRKEMQKNISLITLKRKTLLIFQQLQDKQKDKEIFLIADQEIQFRLKTFAFLGIQMVHDFLKYNNNIKRMENNQKMLPFPQNFCPLIFNPWGYYSYKFFPNFIPPVDPNYYQLKVDTTPLIEAPVNDNSGHPQKSPKYVHKTKMIEKNQKKKEYHLKKRKDEEFKQRQQTINRNLPSNTLKVYLKQIRDPASQTYKNIGTIIRFNQLEYTQQDFCQEIQRHFPKNKNYVVFSKIKALCQGSDDLNPDFSKVLRTSIHRFFNYQIFCLDIKAVRTTRKIRNQQIKQGKIFLRQILK